MIYEGIDRWNSTSLEHYGVKGMKWGVRKVRSVGNRIRSIGARSRQRRYERSDYSLAKKMSDRELQERINRINLEQSYISAVQRDRNSYRDATDNVLMKIGRRTVNGLYNKIINSGSSAIDIGEGLTRNAIINSVNKAAQITKKPKK